MLCAFCSSVKMDGERWKSAADSAVMSTARKGAASCQGDASALSLSQVVPPREGSCKLPKCRSVIKHSTLARKRSPYPDRFGRISMAALKLVLATALLVLAPSAALRIPPSTRPTSHPARSPVIRGPQFWVRRAKPAFSPPLPVGAGLREVDRENLHPIFKLGWVPEDVPLPLLGALALAFSPLLAFVVPIAVAGRKERWERLVAASKAEHGAAFEEATAAYRRQQRLLIDRLLATRSFGERDPLVPCPETGAPQVPPRETRRLDAQDTGTARRTPAPPQTQLAAYSEAGGRLLERRAPSDLS